MVIAPWCKPNFKVSCTPDRRRISVEPQELYAENATEPLREIVSAKYDLDFLDKDSFIDSSLKEVLIKELERTQIERSTSIDEITQKVIPEISNFKESFVETVQGSFTGLPAGSSNTKYFMTQYRADQAKARRAEQRGTHGDDVAARRWSRRARRRF